MLFLDSPKVINSIYFNVLTVKVIAVEYSEERGEIMKRNRKNMMLYLIIAIMVTSAFPLMACAKHGEEPTRAGRANEITINDISIENPFGTDTYPNAPLRVTVDYTLTQAITGVNITVNVTGPLGELPGNLTQQGNQAANNYIVMTNFDFADPGLYTINATVEGWYNGGMINHSMELADENFTTMISYRVDVAIQGAMVGNSYGMSLLSIECVVNNTGNVMVDSTNVTINITDTTTLVEEINITPKKCNLIETTILPKAESDPITFQWIPSHEGIDVSYWINVTATNVTEQDSNTTSIEVDVMDVVDIHLKGMTAPDFVIPDEEFNVSVSVNNSGNAAGTGDVKVSIYPIGEPGNVIWNDTKTSSEVPPKLEIFPVMVDFVDIQLDTPGAYVIKAELIGTAEDEFANLQVNETPNIEPVLDNQSIVLSPEPPVVEGTIITFTVSYSDADGDKGNVTLYLDDEPFAMVNGSDDWAGGVDFTYSWESTVGIHTYYLFAEDVNGGNDTILNATLQPFSFEVTEKTDGWLYGKVVDVDGNVSGAKLVIYSTKLNETNVTVVDEYYNTTTDIDGDYSSFLPFSFKKYGVLVDEDWVEGNGYTGVEPHLKTILLTSDDPVKWANFTLETEPVFETETWLNGTVSDIDGNLSDVDITVVIFVDEPGEMNVTVDDDNVTVNITTRTWMNLTAKTDENGTYSIKDIPFNVIKIGDLPTTATKVYRQDIDGIPEAVKVGQWNVIAHKAGYVDETALLEFEDGETTIWNVTLELYVEVKYKISGIVDPLDATIMIGTMSVSVDNETGAFSIENLTDGSYTLTFTATGYKTTTKTVTINGSDETIGKVELVLDEEEIGDYTVSVGPFEDKNGDGVSGIKVSFSYDGKEWSETTGSSGKAIFTGFPLIKIPEGTPITFSRDGETYTGTSPLTDDELKTFVEPSKKKTDDDSNLIIIIAIIVIVFIIIVLVVLAMKSKGGEEEIEEVREYECPSCGAVVTSDMESCLECGETFEEEEYKCPECTELVEKDATLCDSCGAEFEMPEKIEEEMEDEEMEEELGDEEPETIDEFDVEDEEELEGVEEMAEELDQEDNLLGDIGEDEEFEDLDDL